MNYAWEYIKRFGEAPNLPSFCGMSAPSLDESRRLVAAAVKRGYAITEEEREEFNARLDAETPEGVKT